MSPGEITLGIGLSFISVALGVLSLVKSECDEVSICWGCLQCTKKGKKRQRENNTKELEEEEEVAACCADV